MAIKIGTPSKPLSQAHQKNVETLKAQHKSEINNLNHRHEINKQKTQLANDSDLVKIKTANDQEKLQVLNRKNKILESLDGQIEQIKQIHAKEQMNLDSENKKQLENKRLKHQYAIQNRSLKMQDQIDSQVADGNHQIAQIRRAYQREREQLENSHNSEIRNNKSLSMTEIESQKKEYRIKKDSLQYKYESALRQITQQNNDVLATEQRKGQTEVAKHKKIYDKTIEKTIVDGQEQIATQNKRFESEYKTQKAKHESLLQKLNKNQASLIQKYKNDIYKKVKVIENKALDPFYSVPDITPSIREDSISYRLSVNTTKDQADYYSLTGKGRELKISMSRRFNDKTVSPDGETNLIAKTESTSKTVKVDEIINPKTITKSFKDGVLEFYIEKS